MTGNTSSVDSVEPDADLAGFIRTAERQRDASLALLKRLEVRTHRRIARGYRSLFPLSMLTLFVTGMAEYSRRGERYERFTGLALKSQAKLSSLVNS